MLEEFSLSPREQAGEAGDVVVVQHLDGDEFEPVAVFALVK